MITESSSNRSISNVVSTKKLLEKENREENKMKSPFAHPAFHIVCFMHDNITHIYYFVSINI